MSPRPSFPIVIELPPPRPSLKPEPSSLVMLNPGCSCVAAHTTVPSALMVWIELPAVQAPTVFVRNGDVATELPPVPPFATDRMPVTETSGVAPPLEDTGADAVTVVRPTLSTPSAKGAGLLVIAVQSTVGAAK